jgi:hypothetical protein
MLTAGGKFELLAEEESGSEDDEANFGDDFGGVDVPTLPAGILLRDN